MIKTKLGPASLGLVTNKNIAAAINSTPVPTILYDTAGRVRLWNPAAERLLGWTAEEAIGKLPQHLVKLDSDEIHGLIASVVAGEVIDQRRVHRRRRDGRLVIVRVSAAPIRDNRGSVVGIVSMLLDETDLVETTEARARAEAGFEALFREAPVPIIQLDLGPLMDALGAMTYGVDDIDSHLTQRSGTVRDLLRLAKLTDRNDAAVLALGTDQDVEGFSILTTDLDDNQLVGLATAFLRGEARFSADIDGRNWGAGPRFWRIQVAVARDQDRPDFSRVYLVVVDLTDIHEAHRALRQRELHSRALLDSLDSPTALISAAGVILDSNKAWSDAESKTEVPFGGAVASDYLHDLAARAEIGDVDLAACHYGVLDVLAGRRNSCSIEYCVTRDDRTAWFSMDAVRFAGSQPGAVITHRDITGARLTVDEMANAIDRRDKFISVLAHQIRTPLTAVVGFSRILGEAQNGIDTLESQEILELLIQQSEDLSALVDSLITNTRATEGILSIETTTVDLVEEIEAVLAGLSKTEKRRIVFQPLPMAASADPWRVRQVIRNLVLNSLRHGQDLIMVELRADSHHAHVVVSDSQVGMSPERPSEVFSDSTEGDTVSHWTRAIGLGVARRLARLMRGDILYRQTGRNELDLSLPLVS